VATLRKPPFDGIRDALAGKCLTWLVTGSAGFIGSHLVETLLGLNQQVTGLDNFSTGHRENLRQIEDAVGPQAWKRHRFIEGSVADLETCREACRRADIVLHQAALGSVPRSIADPLATHAANVTGFANLPTDDAVLPSMHILRKPFDLPDILRAVNQCLERVSLAAAA